MSDAARRPMTADEFLVWCLDQDGTWELVEGRPVLKDPQPEMMAGARQEHDLVRGNLEAALRTRLRGRCRVWGEAIGIRVASGRLRRPDVTVDCGPRRQGSAETDTPTVIFEVLSPGTRGNDILRKPREYRELPTLQAFVIVDPLSPDCWVWSRGEDGAWTDRYVRGLDAVLALPAIDVSLPLSDVYEDVELDGGG